MNRFESDFTNEQQVLNQKESTTLTLAGIEIVGNDEQSENTDNPNCERFDPASNVIP
jgi:hypothetical protein